MLAFAEGGADSQFLAAVAVAIWLAVIVGVVIRVWPGSEAPRAAVACGGSLAALCVLGGLSMVWASDPGRAFEDVARLTAYLGLFALIVLASRRSSSGAWARGIAAGLGGLAAAALLAFFQPSLFGDAATSLASAIPSAAGRLSYPVGYWNGLGACMALAVVLLGWLAARATRARGGRPRPPSSRSPSSRSTSPSRSAVPPPRSSASPRCSASPASAPRFSPPRRRASSPASSSSSSPRASTRSPPVSATRASAPPATRCCRSRSPAPSPRPGSGGPSTIRSSGSTRARPRVPRGAAIAIALAALAALVVVADPLQRWDDFKDPGALAELPASGEGAAPAAGEFATAAGNGRYQWWAEGLDAFASEPLTGIGAGNYELYWNAHHTLPVVVADAHSLYVETLAELGPLGLLFLLGFLATAVGAGIGRRASTRGGVAVWLGVLAAGIVSAAGEWTWEIPAATIPLVMAAAVLTGPATLRPRWPRALPQNGPPSLSERFASGPSPRERFGLGVAVLLAGFACIWWSGVGFLVELQLSESRSAFDRGDFAEAASNASYAGAIQPWAAAPRLQLAQAEEARGRYDEARAAALEGVERSPGDWRGYVVLARIEARDGQPAAAEEALATANGLSSVPIPVELPGPG